MSWLLGVPGASACLLEATVPYSKVACEERMAIMATVPPSYCSKEVRVVRVKSGHSRSHGSRNGFLSIGERDEELLNDRWRGGGLHLVNP